MLAAWWIDIHPPGEAIVISTAPTYKQVHAVLWGRDPGRSPQGQASRPGSPNRRVEDRRHSDVGMGRKPADHDPHGFWGIHRRYVLAILDEACGIPDALWTAVEAITTNADCRILAIGNPDDPATEFGRVCSPVRAGQSCRSAAFDTPQPVRRGRARTSSGPFCPTPDGSRTQEALG